ncbi:hypothetical protein MKEN_01209400 [Mycena kentingensis (nom. inval.)]|nr:hypothetical protein MKEN_01209400 [Mycena kentingensis (nom. inval.)]
MLSVHEGDYGFGASYSDAEMLDALSLSEEGDAYSDRQFLDDSSDLEEEHASEGGEDADGDDLPVGPLEDNPHYRSLEDIFAPPSDDEKDEDDRLEPPAFSEPSYIRNAYISVYANSAFRRATHIQSKYELAGIRDALTGAGITEGMDSFAQTIRTVERRLGIDVDQDIIPFVLCPKCWKRYDPSVLTDPDFESECQASTLDGAHCGEELYTVKKLTKRAKRVPKLIMPFFPPDLALKRMLARPGKYEECQHWRRDDDHEQAPPISRQQWVTETDPTTPLRDIHDGWRWRNVPAHVERQWDAAHKRVLDIVPENLEPIRFVSLPCGLLLTINLDWFQPMESRIHSSGALWLTVNNLPRAIRFLPGEGTFLVLMIPGEPSKEQLNECVDPVVEHIERVYKGEMWKVYGSEIPKQVNTALLVVSADGPARLKISGFVSSNSEEHMCIVCDKPFSSLVHAHCFDPEQFNFRDEDKQLRYKFIAANSTNREYIDRIAALRGVRASSLDRIPGWRPVVGSPTDLMHMLYLRLSSIVHKEILHGNGMFNAREDHDVFGTFNAFLEHIEWPGDAGRVRSRIGAGAGKIKADEWRNLMVVYPVAVAYAWWTQEGSLDIPSGDAPESQTRSKTKTAAQRASELFEKRAKKNAQRDPNFAPKPDPDGSGASTRGPELPETLPQHPPILYRSSHPRLAFHLPRRRSYAWWVFAFERLLGQLGRYNTNGHGGGEMEMTMMRSWWKAVRCQQLIELMQALPDRSPEDERALNILIQGLKASAGEESRQRGTLEQYLASLAAEGVPTAESIKLPKQSRKVNLRTIDREIYERLLIWAQHNLWPDKHLIRDYGFPENGIQLLSAARSFATVQHLGTKYGAVEHGRGQKFSLAFVNGREAVQIRHILEIQLSDGTTQLIAQVTRFIPASGNLVECLPWFAWASDLGIGHWESGTGEGDFVKVTQLCGRFARAKILVNDTTAIELSFSLDHSGVEPAMPDDDWDEERDME